MNLKPATGERYMSNHHWSWRFDGIAADMTRLQRASGCKIRDIRKGEALTDYSKDASSAHLEPGSIEYRLQRSK